MKDLTGRKIVVGDTVYYAVTCRHQPMKSGKALVVNDNKVKLDTSVGRQWSTGIAWIGRPERCIVVNP